MSRKTLGMMSGKVRVASVSELDANRSEFLSLENAEPNLGVPSANNGIVASSTAGSRIFLNPTQGLTVDASDNLFVNEDTVPIDTAGFNFSTSSVLSAVLFDLDQNLQTVSTTAEGNIDSVSTDATLSGDGTVGNALSVVGGNADTLNNQSPAFYLNYNNFTNTPTIGDGTLTVSSGSGLTGSGTFTANQTTNATIAVSHADTSTQLSVNNSGGTVIQDVTLDGFGHVTALGSKTLTASDVGALSTTGKAADADLLDGQDSPFYLNYNNFTNTPTIGNGQLTVSGGSGLTGSGTFNANQTTAASITINHADTSSQASVNNSGGTVIQDITLDTYGHITAVGSVDLDTRYLQAETDTLDSVTDRGSTTTNSVSVGSVQVDSVTQYDSDSTTLATTTQTSIASFSSTTFGGAKLIVQITNTVTSERQMSELLLAHDGTNAYATEYGVVFTGTDPLASFDVDISGGNVRLLATGATSNSTTYKVTEILTLA